MMKAQLAKHCQSKRLHTQVTLTIIHLEIHLVTTNGHNQLPSQLEQACRYTCSRETLARILSQQFEEFFNHQLELCCAEFSSQYLNPTNIKERHFPNFTAHHQQALHVYCTWRRVDNKKLLQLLGWGIKNKGELTSVHTRTKPELSC